ncbi:hypothetical protein [Pseudonocardia sp.]|uniref:hypothetical protein n=1 Tax=Pseudonocardia sp. TaxID=60912 RepID=UPI002627B3E9|nr:hypothetical protein [Pseudonocardia sp.]
MSSLARRSLRTTAAAAGIAALGVGLAGHAFAAPELPAAPALPGTEGLGALEGMAGVPELPAAPSAEGFSMPGVINFEAPSVNTAGPELPALDAFAVPAVPAAPAMPAAPQLPAAPAAPSALTAPEVPSLPEAPTTDGIVNHDLDAGTGEAAQPENQVAGNDQMDAMQALDMAAFAMDMAQSAAAGESVTQNQEIG